MFSQCKACKHQTSLTSGTIFESTKLPLSGFLQVDDAYQGGKRWGGKRGRFAPGKTPFLAAVATNEDGHPISMKFSQVNGFTKDEITSWALKHVHPECIVVSDGLNCFPGFV